MLGRCKGDARAMLRRCCERVEEERVVRGGAPRSSPTVCCVLCAALCVAEESGACMAGARMPW
eukprot:scaffold38322_cov56-Phaeocystis_antarctica.AAC.1